MTEKVDCVVIGAGVVGLAIARGLAMAGREVITLEAADAIGTQTSSRNSEVIHAGIYYPKGSLKARLCVQGRDMMYAFCNSHGVVTKKTGKLVFAANDSEIAGLRALQEHSGSNGVPLAWLDAAEVRNLEPQLECAAALLSPETGIVDSHSFMLALQGDGEAHGAVIAFNSPVISGQTRNDGTELRVGGSEATTLVAKTAINCAGLGARAISSTVEGLDPATIPSLHYAKGNYFYLSGKAPFAKLIYPLPGKASLGLHYTLDLSGQARFGPDIEWTDSLSYAVDPERAPMFYDAVREYWPGLPDDALRPGYAGIRPKLQAKGGPAMDFVIQFPQETGCSGYCALYGIESPGLTSSLAIADYVVERLA
ncbi:MAG: NAD(P)/FAD-dependent oxidoreductase [Rhodospirillaceae bacterium]|nr:NAD(P)/FAD-dependent oxidoreductase [Rhodospirillaceae bacterium]